jgi:hypothetical protein
VRWVSAVSMLPIDEAASVQDATYKPLVSLDQAK